MTDIIWQGHEAEAYLLANANNVEINFAVDAGYERVTTKAGSALSGNIKSTPDWAARNEIWHKFTFTGNDNNSAFSTGMVVWACQNAAGQILAQILTAAGPTGQFQVWNGAAFVNVGAAFAMLAVNNKVRFDIHFKAAVAGQVEVWYGNAGTQSKVVDTAADYSAAANIVRIYHASIASNGGTEIGHAIVQTASTLSSTSEIKPPTSNGADVGGTGTWADVDENIYSDVDLINLSAAAQRQSFKAAARTLTQAIVTGVTASCRAWYEVGGPTQVKPYLTIGGVRYYGTTFNLGLTAQGYQYTWTTNPATAVAFTPAEANAAALEWGWEAV
jgi:hypothetical protein